MLKSERWFKHVAGHKRFASTQSRLRRILLPAPVAVLLTCVVLTGAVARFEYCRAVETHARKLHWLTQDAAAAVQTRLSDYQMLLYAARGHADAGNLHADRWRTFAQAIYGRAEDAGIVGVALVERVAGVDVDQFEQVVREEYAPDFTVNPRPPEGRDAFVIRYHEPRERNRVALGYDIAANPRSLPAQLAARDGGSVTLSATTSLRQDEGRVQRTGIVMYAALYEGGGVPASVTERRARHIGYAGLPVVADDLLRPIARVLTNANQTFDGLTGRVLDRGDLGLDSHQLALSRPSESLVWQTSSFDDDEDHTLASTHIHAGGRRWTLQLAADPSRQARTAAAGIVLGGFALSVPLTLLTWMLAARRRQSQEFAGRMGRRAAMLERRFRAAFHGTDIGMGLADLDGRWTSANGAMCALLGRGRNEIERIALQDSVHPADLVQITGVLQRLVGGEVRHAQLECRIRRPDAKDVWASINFSAVHPSRDNVDTEDAYLIVQARDVSRRRRLERRLAHAAAHDALTGLAKRPELESALEAACREVKLTPTGSRAATSGFAVLFFDLDRFKQVNDTLGHEAGDQLLRGVAGRLRAQLRDNADMPGSDRWERDDVAARFGGDEFAVLLRGVTSPEAAVAVAERLRASICRPFRLHGRDVHVGASVGISTSFTGEHDPKVLLRQADAAMYDAKQAGRSSGSGVVLHGSPPPVEPAAVEPQIPHMRLVRDDDEADSPHRQAA
jgi:diguanylate cyclase (GGDEF)-like protein/PAS domain S-box-containing protein